MKRFYNKEGADFTYLRGRRRVGKSSLLKEFSKKISPCFFYTGSKDLSAKNLLADFSAAWDNFTREKRLSIIKEEELSWSIIFKSITEYLRQSEKKVLIVFDEIQWIAKTGSGFVGQLKNYWLEWKDTKKIKLIIAGSSNKFFAEQTGGEEKILRGMKTFAEIWVHPFSLSEVKKYFFPQYSEEQVCLIYMMLGGIPYYLEQIIPQENFIRTINQAIFTKDTIFLDEVNEVLNLELNLAGTETAKKILSLLGQYGKTQKQLVEISGMPESSLRSILEKLLDYKILYLEESFQKKNNFTARDRRYYMKDCYLNFYFQVLLKLEIQIRQNLKQLLFALQCLQSQKGYYMPNFSGLAFEMLIQNLVETDLSGFAHKLGILNDKFDVYRHIKVKNKEFDLILKSDLSREIKLIQIKWISDSMDIKVAEDIAKVEFPDQKNYKINKYIISSHPTSKVFKDFCRKENIYLLSIKDLF